MVKPGDLYYYCPGCKRFHEHFSSAHKGVNRKLCFICEKIQLKKTKIVGNDEDGRIQICDKCLSENTYS
ncbi:hypothetical protein ABE021_14315 [Sporosarcina gallistercoris]|uniref:hypothetical protein n=1 Tax=Caryophanaceae TaxID=186818 RepID=UPI000D3B4F3E|nr:hypothetical protein [Metalysinibacillus jejuensis]